MVQSSAVVIESQQERAHQCFRTLLVPAETGHDAIGRPDMLDFDHRALAGLIDRALVLGDDTVEPSPFEAMEPVLRHGPVATAGRDMDTVGRLRERLFE